MSTPRCFVTIRGLRTDGPCFLTQAHGITLVAVDPGARKVDILFWMQENLTPEETTTFLTAYGQEPGADLEDWMFHGVVSGYVPAAIRLDGEKAVQGILSGEPEERRLRELDYPGPIAV